MDSFDNITRVEKNAPDTIYFPADGLPSYIDWDGSPIRTKQVEDSDVCYIRKDALIEWLKGYNHPVTRIVVQELIDKINSL